MYISQRAKNTLPSPTLAITALAKSMKEQGIDVISFGAGEPDFNTPDVINQAAIDAINSGFTRYTPTAGIDPLRQAIADKLLKDNGLSYKSAQVVVTCGAKHALFGIFQAICDPGDEVIIPAPYWVSYPEQVKLAGGVPVYVTADSAANFIPDPAQIEAAVTPKTRAIVINSPNNPSGAVFPEAVIRAIADIAVKHGIYLISDEIYEKMVYGTEHFSVASISEEVKKLTIVVNGMSKANAMTGWRIGYAAAELDLVKAIVRMQDQSTSNPTSIAQKAALAALKAPESLITDMVAAFNERRAVIVQLLNDIPGFNCPNPGGAFYAFPDVSGVYGKSFNGKPINSSDDFAEYLLNEARVAVVPGRGFGLDSNIRLSYACSMDNIRQGIARIAEAVSKLS